ncbi:MAG: DUF378 domain-containing protein [Erysipelotrichales bacterium]|nr:DUF378 domain-containing protein [Erysipelotrichales bacterium]
MNSYLKLFMCVTIFAAIYLGIDGLFNFDLLKYIFKTNATFIDVLKIVFGISGIISILSLQNKS